MRSPWKQARRSTVHSGGSSPQVDRHACTVRGSLGMRASGYSAPSTRWGNSTLPTPDPQRSVISSAFLSCRFPVSPRQSPPVPIFPVIPSMATGYAEEVVRRRRSSQPSLLETPRRGMRCLPLIRTSGKHCAFLSSRHVSSASSLSASLVRAARILSVETSPATAAQVRLAPSPP